jgi:uncharacterized membrane protein YjgN (DUF898 family)
LQAGSRSAEFAARAFFFRMTSESVPSPRPEENVSAPVPDASPPAHDAPVAPPIDGEVQVAAESGAEPPLLPPPPVVAAPPSSAVPEPPRHAFTFHGDAREYFRIWIVNTLLTLLTLGVYSAWAKVRKRRYLRGNTELMGYRFDYLADPRRILVGNILVVLMFIAYMVVGEVYPAVRFGALGVGLLLLPWVVVRSLAFNAHNTAYRGMRFTCRRTNGAAALLFLGQWLVIAITFGLYYPAWVRNRKEFVINGHRLGDAFFRFESKSGPFYLAYLVSGGTIAGAACCGAMITGLVTGGNAGKVPSLLQLLPFFALYGLALFFAKHFVYAYLFNHIWNHTRLDRHRFTATLSTEQWLKLQFVNLGALIISAGLLYPWTAVRSARYALSCLHFSPAGPIENISRLGRSDGSAVGETAAEFVGLDFGL